MPCPAYRGVAEIAGVTRESSQFDAHGLQLDPEVRNKGVLVWPLRNEPAYSDIFRHEPSFECSKTGPDVPYAGNPSRAEFGVWCE